MIKFDGHYSIAGCDVAQLAQKYGTPLYVYDTETIRTQYEKLTGAFSKTRLSV
jgi:diaminopimelate decarboxylase